MKMQGKMWMLACGLAGMLGATTVAHAADQPPASPSHDPMKGDNQSENAAAGTSAPQNGLPPAAPTAPAAPTPTAPAVPTPAAPTPAEAPAPAPVTSTLPEAVGDPTWTAVKLHRVNLMEIKAGKAEQANGESPRVKSFASHIVRDHQAADRQLAAYAKKHRIALNGSESGPTPNNDATPSSDDQDDMQMQADLRALKGHKGRDLDQAFLTNTIAGHDKAIEMVRGARQATKDSDLATLLDQVLPSLQSHRDDAATLNNTINGTSSR